MAAYSILFPVRPRVLEKFTGDEIALAARVVFWQHPPEDCVIPGQELTLTWMDDLLDSGAKLIRVDGDVIPAGSSAECGLAWR